MTTINRSFPVLDGKVVELASAQFPSAIGVSFPSPAPLTAFIYNQTLFAKCSSSPTGACIGFFQKNFGGALAGWNFIFWDSEDWPSDDPLGSFTSRFAVQSMGNMDFLAEGVDEGTGVNGTTLFQLCQYFQSTPENGFLYTSAVTNSNSQCLYETEFEVTYTDTDECP